MTGTFDDILTIHFCFRMKEKKIILGIEGKDKNTVILLPPLCFTQENARNVVQAFSDSLAAIESDAARLGGYCRFKVY